MSDVVREAQAFVAYWPFDFAFFMGLFALLLIACLVAPWLRRGRSDGGGS